MKTVLQNLTGNICLFRIALTFFFLMKKFNVKQLDCNIKSKILLKAIPVIIFRDNGQYTKFF